jgi:DNA-binding SARP family transcriptional activator
MTTEAPLRLALLGGFEARLQDGSALVLPTKKSQALLAYLALPAGRIHTREQLATLLWGDMPEPQARGNLRQGLSRLRNALPRPVRPAVIFDGPTVALDTSIVEVDVAPETALLRRSLISRRRGRGRRSPRGFCRTCRSRPPSCSAEPPRSPRCRTCWEPTGSSR